MIISNTHIVSLHAEKNVQIDTSLDVMATSLLHVCKIWMRVWDGNLNSHVNMLLQNWKHYTLNNQLFLWSYNREIWSDAQFWEKLITHMIRGLEKIKRYWIKMLFRPDCFNLQWIANQKCYFGKMIMKKRSFSIMLFKTN